MRYHFKIEKEGKGFMATCIELPGCHTQADSKKELEENMFEALNLFLDEPADSKCLFPLPKKRVPAGDHVVSVPVDPKVAFSCTLRRMRVLRGLTQRQVAEKLGIKNLYSYQRLENSKTANPELATIAELKKVFPDLSIDDLLSA